MLLGFLLDSDDKRARAFFRTSAFSLAVPDRRFWSPRDCRHGRVLFCSKGKRVPEFLVWEPVTGNEWVVPAPAAYKLRYRYSSSAVVCATDGCDHRDCRGDPFRVVLLFPEKEEVATSACVYSLEIGAWGELTSVHDIRSYSTMSSVLVGGSKLYFLTDIGYIIEYDLSTHSLRMIERLRRRRSGHLKDAVRDQRMVLMVAEDGGLGITDAEEWTLYLWSREVSDAGDAKWVLRREIHLSLGSWLPDAALSELGPTMMGFAEETITIFMSIAAGIFVIDLQLGRVKKVFDHEFSFNILVPIVSSGYTLPAPRREYRYPPEPNYSEEEELVSKEALDRAHKLFIKGRKAIEQENFVDAIDCLSHALKISAAHYGEHAPQCVTTYYFYGCALLYKAREKSVKSTISKAYTGNSKASGGNVEGAPSLEEGEPEEGQNSNGIAQEDKKCDGEKAHDEMAGDEDDSDLSLARKMFDITRAIVEESLGNAMGFIFSAPGESASAAEGSSKFIQEDELEVHIAILAELEKKLEDLEQALINLVPMNEQVEIEVHTAKFAELEKKLEDLEQAMSTPSSAAVEIMKRIVSQAEQNVGNALSRVALTSSEMAGLNNSFDFPIMPTSSATGSSGTSVADFGTVVGGFRRAEVEHFSAEPSPKRLAVVANDSPSVKGDSI